jgi:hypothetical protein
MTVSVYIVTGWNDYFIDSISTFREMVLATLTVKEYEAYRVYQVL